MGFSVSQSLAQEEGCGRRRRDRKRNQERSKYCRGEYGTPQYLVPSRFKPSCVTPEMARCLGPPCANHNANQSMMGRPAVARQCLFSHGLPLPHLLPTGLQSCVLLHSEGLFWIPIAGFQMNVVGSERCSACASISAEPHSQPRLWCQKSPVSQYDDMKRPMKISWWASLNHRCNIWRRREDYTQKRLILFVFI